MKNLIPLVLPLFLVLAVSFGLAQNNKIFIYDSNGNSASGSINDGNLYLQDSKGNTTFGTIKDGKVFVQGSNGEAIIGTVRDGNVFLTDNKGTSTGVIRDGHIFLNHSDGSTTIGNYDANGNVHTSTTGLPATQDQDNPDRPRDDEEQKRIAAEKQKEVEAGQVVGAALGNAIGGAIANHQINAYCKANPTATVVTNDGISILCPRASLDSFEQAQVDSYCRDNPGSWISVGKHREDCQTPPDPPNMKWAQWEMKTWREAFKHRSKTNATASADQVRTVWNYWQPIYCSLAPPNAEYKDLEGKKQMCH